MARRPIWFAFFLALSAFFLTLLLFILGIAVGPQSLHHFNIFLIVCSIISFFIALFQFIKWKNLTKKTILLLFIIIGLTLLSFISSSFLIKIKYGYGNWKYKNIFTLYYNRDEVYSEFTTNLLMDLQWKSNLYFKKMGKYPEKLEDLIIIDPNYNMAYFKDSWDTPLEYQDKHNFITIRSAGADTIMYTKDDIVNSQRY